MKLAIFLPLFVLYMVPSMIGWARRTRDLGMVVVLNLVLGWTVLGWLIALALAFRDPREADRPFEYWSD